MCDNKTLKPCPFCGEMPHLEEDYESNFFAVYCGNIECEMEPFTDTHETASEAIEVWNKRAENYENMYKKAAAHNRQLIDDIEKADSDYFKMKKSRDGWKGAFYKAIDMFNELSDICDKLIIVRDTLMKENDELKNELKSMDCDFRECREGYENDIESLKAENEKLKNALESSEKDAYNYQNVCETLVEENGRLKKMIQLCGSY